MELLALAVPIPPAPPVPLALLDPLAPPAPPAPPAPLEVLVVVLELLLELEALLEDELDPLLEELEEEEEELVLAPPSGMYGVQGAPASVTPQINGASHLFVIALQTPLQHAFAAAAVQASPEIAQWLKVCTPAMHTPLVDGSVRSTIVALIADGTWHL